VYGTFAAFPVFLLWMYFSWYITLAVALVTANLPRARAPRKPRPDFSPFDGRLARRR
jgi:membrane protein